MANGPYFPRRGQKPIGAKSNIRPPRPHFNMLLHTSQIEATKVCQPSILLNALLINQ